MTTKPLRLFQIMITDGDQPSVATTDTFARNVESFRSTYPDAEYQRYGNDELVAFLTENYPEPVLQAYRALTPYAFKADLARYCLLHTYGGLYSDLSYATPRGDQTEPNLPGVGVVKTTASLAWSNSIFAPCPGRTSC